MIKMIPALTISLASAFASSAFSQIAPTAEPVRIGPISYQNSDHQNMQRWIVIETWSANRSLFLVVDEFPPSTVGNAEAAPLPQLTIDREVVSSDDILKLAQLKKYYSSLADLGKGGATNIAGLPSPGANPAPPAVHQPLVGRPLWVPVKNTWTRSDEDDYSNWIATKVGTDFLLGSITKVDCADFAMLLRWVYARDHKLPMADTLAGSGSQLFGHFSSNSAWDQLPEDPDWKKDHRFQAALAYVLKNTYTHSLWSDLYPTTVDKAHVRPGTIYLFLRNDDGHTQTIKSIGPNPDMCGDGQCIVTYWGDEPAAQSVFVSSLIEPDVNGGIGNTKSGFLMWRWPRLNNQKWELTPANQMQDYSTLQYRPPITATTDPLVHHDEYWSWLQAQLGLPPQTSLDLLKMNLEGFANHLQLRLMITAQAQVYCVYQTCPKGSPAEGDYSTPNGDSEMMKLSYNVTRYYMQVHPDDPNVAKLMAEYSTPVILGQPSTHSLWNLAMNQNGVLYTFSSDASANFAQRWGLQASIGQPDLEYPLMATELELLYKQRDTTVAQAVSVCYPNGASSPNCDVNNPEIAALNTKTLDAALRSFISKFVQLEKNGVSGNTKSAVQTYLEQTTMSTDAGTNVYEEILGSGAGRLQNWSSNPVDTGKKRWGL